MGRPGQGQGEEKEDSSRTDFKTQNPLALTIGQSVTCQDHHGKPVHPDIAQKKDSQTCLICKAADRIMKQDEGTDGTYLIPLVRISQPGNGPLLS